MYLTKKMDKKQRIYGLDILRAIAIMSVVIRHMYDRVGLTLNIKLTNLLSPNGVSIFFVLSGYLIGGVLLKRLTEHGPVFSNLFGFWRDRWLRTLPAYYFILGIIIVIEVYHGAWWRLFLREVLFLQNITGNHLYAFGESWSLAVEEWFYLIVPILFFLSVKIMPLKKAVPTVFWCVTLLAMGVRIFRTIKYGITETPYGYHVWWNRILISVPTRVDSIMFGVLGAYLNFYKFRIWTNYRNLLCAVGITGFLINHIYNAFSEFNYYILFFQKQVEVFFILMTLPKFSEIKEGRGNIARVITFIAIISYSIYLVHGTIYQEIIQPIIQSTLWIQLICYFLWAIGGAYLLHITVEKWGMSFRQKLRNRKLLRTIKKEGH